MMEVHPKLLHDASEFITLTLVLKLFLQAKTNYVESMISTMAQENTIKKITLSMLKVTLLVQ